MTDSERDALSLFAGVMHPDRDKRHDSYGSIRRIAARAGGMVYRDRHLLMRTPACYRDLHRQVVRDDAPCLIRTLAGKS